jgi:hypothetical protein
MKEIKYETMRSSAAATTTFRKDFAVFLASRQKDDWNVNRCTFFRDDEKKKCWAFCAFER